VPWRTKSRSDEKKKKKGLASPKVCNCPVWAGEEKKGKTKKKWKEPSEQKELYYPKSEKKENSAEREELYATGRGCLFWGDDISERSTGRGKELRTPGDVQK